MTPVLVSLAYRPFLDPLDVHNIWWLFLAPFAFGIAMVYKAVRLRTLGRYWLHVLMMTVQIIFGMIALAVASYLFVEVYVRFIVDRIG